MQRPLIAFVEVTLPFWSVGNHEHSRLIIATSEMSAFRLIAQCLEGLKLGRKPDQGSAPRAYIPFVMPDSIRHLAIRWAPMPTGARTQGPERGRANRD